MILAVGSVTFAAMPRWRQRPVWRGGLFEKGAKNYRFYLDPAHFGGEEKILKTWVEGDTISIDLFSSVLRYESEPALIQKIAEVLRVNIPDIDSVAFSTNVRDYVVGIKNEDVLLRMKPDFAAMKAMAEAGPFQHEGLMVSALAPKGAECDLFVRVFLPITGVNEDIACGSGNCSIIPYWHNKGLNADTLCYKTIFPFPEGPKGFVGGVQNILYKPDLDLIRICAKAEKSVVALTIR